MITRFETTCIKHVNKPISLKSQFPLNLSETHAFKLLLSTILILNEYIGYDNVIKLCICNIRVELKVTYGYYIGIGPMFAKDVT